VTCECGEAEVLEALRVNPLNQRASMGIVFEWIQIFEYSKITIFKLLTEWL
jgi:hypothetical protein